MSENKQPKQTKGSSNSKQEPDWEKFSLDSAWTRTLFLSQIQISNSAESDDEDEPQPRKTSDADSESDSDSDECLDDDDDVDDELIEYYSNLSLMHALGKAKPKDEKEITLQSEKDRAENLKRFIRKIKETQRYEDECDSLKEEIETTKASNLEMLKPQNDKEEEDTENEDEQGDPDDLMNNRFMRDITEMVNAIGGIFPFNEASHDEKFELHKELEQISTDFANEVERMKLGKSQK